MNKKVKKITEDKIIQRIINRKRSESDPNGSYTGKPENKYEKPVQDADDL